MKVLVEVDDWELRNIQWLRSTGLSHQPLGKICAIFAKGYNIWDGKCKTCGQVCFYKKDKGMYCLDCNAGDKI